MKGNPWMHVGWAVTAAVAFYIGFKLAGPGSGGTGESGAAVAGSSDRGADGRLLASGAPSGGPRDRSRKAGPLEQIFGHYSLERVGMEALISQAVQDPSPITRRLAFARLLQEMTPENALEIRQQLVALSPDDQTWRDFNYAWGAIAGREAFDFARQSEEADLGPALMGWAAADPQGALAAMDQLPPELQGQRAQLERDLVAGIADNNLDLATQVALRLGTDNERQTRQLMRTVANEVLRTGGTEGATQWVALLPDGEAKGAAMQRVTETLVNKDPVQAAAWAERFAEHDYAAAAIGEIGEEWAETDGAAAVAWLETLPEGTAQNRGYSAALGEWEDRDPQAAGEYLMSMDVSPQRDAAIAGFARGYAWQDPQTAIAWAEAITDPAIRQQSLIRVGYAYHRRDPENARVWLQNSGLTPQQQRAAMRGRR